MRPRETQEPGELRACRGTVTLEGDFMCEWPAWLIPPHVILNPPVGPKEEDFTCEWRAWLVPPEMFKFNSSVGHSSGRSYLGHIRRTGPGVVCGSLNPSSMRPGIIENPQGQLYYQ